MNFADETKGERKAVPHEVQTMIQGRHIVGDFLQVVQGNAML
jgi:hypothetical protein